MHVSISDRMPGHERRPSVGHAPGPPCSKRERGAFRATGTAISCWKRSQAKPGTPEGRCITSSPGRRNSRLPWWIGSPKRGSAKFGSPLSWRSTPGRRSGVAGPRPHRVLPSRHRAGDDGVAGRVRRSRTSRRRQGRRDRQEISRRGSAPSISAGRRDASIPPGPPAKTLGAAITAAVEGLAIHLAGAPHDEVMAERMVRGLLGIGAATTMTASTLGTLEPCN